MCECTQDNDGASLDGFIDDSANHSQGDNVVDDAVALYVQNRCMNVIDIIDGEEIFCDDLCAPSQQFCHFCSQTSLRSCGL